MLSGRFCRVILRKFINFLLFEGQELVRQHYFAKEVIDVFFFFRKTRFGNGQFAVLILCLTVADLLVVFVGILGALVLEVRA